MCFIHKRKSLDQLWPNAHWMLPSFRSGLSFSLPTCRCVAVIASHQSDCVNTTCGPTFTRAGVARWRFPVSHTLDYCIFYIPRRCCTKPQSATNNKFSWFPNVIPAKNRNRLLPLSFLGRWVSWKVPATWIQERRGPFITTTLLFSLIALCCFFTWSLFQGFSITCIYL